MDDDELLNAAGGAALLEMLPLPAAQRAEQHAKQQHARTLFRGELRQRLDARRRLLWQRLLLCRSLGLLTA